MRTRDKRKKISIYINKKDKLNGKKLYKLIMERLYNMEVSGCSMFQTMASYGTGYRIRYQNKFTFAKYRGIEIVVIETEKKARQILEEIQKLVPNGIITIEEIEMIRLTESGPTAEDSRLVQELGK